MIGLGLRNSKPDTAASRTSCRATPTWKKASLYLGLSRKSVGCLQPLGATGSVYGIAWAQNSMTILPNGPRSRWAKASSASSNW
jgi:hypothetical protein